ncbi:Pre-B-cell colony enhancing factor 1 [Dirofilaria immitis]|nr:Pre-B-cell colony enhancing factor 1 [Dirofilaria immitis]
MIPNQIKCNGHSEAIVNDSNGSEVVDRPTTNDLYPYYFYGTVVVGFGRGGRQLGCPTANLDDNAISRLPSHFPCGVFYGFANVNHGEVYGMVTSIGWNPQFKNERKTIEVHIFHDFEEDFYGAEIRAVLVGFLRPMDQLFDCIKMESVENVLYVADSYKVTHHNQYPEGTTHVYSYFESRGGKFPEVCFFGLQYIIKRWLVGPVVTKTMVEEAKQFYKSHFGSQRLSAVKNQSSTGGYGSARKNVLFTVENTDPRVPWLTNWFETLLVQVWYPITVCTNSRAQKLIIARYLHETADSIDGIHFKLHDFGYRGASSVESASIGGAAHLVNFYGTDTIAGLQLCKKYYAAEMAGFSIPAAEHSTITTWKKSGESAAYLNMLEQFPDGSVSVVSDSYDVFHAVSNIWGDELRQYVVDRANKGCVVIRPDSGDPSEVVVKVLNLLAEKFPTVTNSKGYRLLPSYLRVIQGDGICYESLGNILDAMTRNKWSADNIVFGTGGALLQKLDRDTQKCAFKCSHVVINGESRDVWKSPTTDTGKQSKQGRLTLERREDGSLVTIEKGKGDVSKDILVTVFENGKLLVDYSLEEIRNRAELDIVKEHKRKAVNVEATVKTTNEGSWTSANGNFAA